MMIITETAGGALRRLTDQELAAEAARLERRLDRLDAATWPDAGRERAELADAFAEVRAEIERRRT